MLVAAQPHVVAHDVQHAHHLAEDQHPVRCKRACFIAFTNAQQVSPAVSGGSTAVRLDRERFQFREHHPMSVAS